MRMDALTLKSRSASLSHDVMRAEWRPLGAFFAPENIAVIGANERVGSVGRTLLWNLVRNPFGGTVFPVNPGRSQVLGIKAYPSIMAVPDRVDLAVIATPAPTVPDIIAECVNAGVQAAIIVSAGFKEIGAEGIELERRIKEQAQRGDLRIIGPNCLGVMNPLSGLNATFAGAMAQPGKIAFLSQSGALGAAVLDWSLRANVGFSAFVSIGSMLDVGWGDLIDYLGADSRTTSIILYIESIGDARGFLSAAREVALNKPIIALKAGRTQAAAKAAASHTGSLTGSDEALDAAFRRCGVLRVDRISEMFSMAEVLAMQPRPKGPGLSIITNAGGPGVIATDALINGGGELAPLAPETIGALDRILPAHWSHANPVDILGDAEPDRYARALEIAAKDPNTDGLLVVLSPQAMTDPTQTAERLKGFAKVDGKPILASWMGGAEVSAGEAILQQASIPTFPFPDAAAGAFNHMWRYSRYLHALYETPSPQDDDHAPDRAAASALIAGVRETGRAFMTEAESKRLLALYGIPTVPTQIAASEDQAVVAAERVGFPVVLKLHSETITHKTDVGGVCLNLADRDAVRSAYRRILSSVCERAGREHFLGVTVQPMIKLEGYELIIGSSPDPQFGPVLLFGTGGQLVEVLHDRALALPPLTSTLARRMMERTRIFTALKGVRGRDPVDLAALEQLLVRFSQLVVEQPGIKEIDINPLLAAPGRLLALDARVVVYGPGVSDDQLPRPAIKPYPTQYVVSRTLADGTPITIRPIRPEDEPLLVHFHEVLSESTVRLRYFQSVNLSRRVAHERLTRICFISYDREMVLVADSLDPGTDRHQILAVGRLSRLRRGDEAELALLVRDDAQNKGLGTVILRHLLDVGRGERIRCFQADILPQNRAMQHICQKLGFHLEAEDPSVVKAELEL
ncbi:MAG: bifunctional acetate--CoA ligase family protein/GNAT family N-acetyltransferase [Planctomycetaceae bacterium]|nr:bifunctional acetate--CoA ligase family protein/GNAT family N-acetyltransferase [Planctomycetaceae bacterium]